MATLRPRLRFLRYLTRKGERAGDPMHRVEIEAYRARLAPRDPDRPAGAPSLRLVAKDGVRAT